MSSAIRQQAEIGLALEGRHESISIRSIELPRQYEKRQKLLCTGDLVYIRGREDGPITHVVIWVGSVGRAASGVPLVIDSHGSGVADDDGRPIPCGVQLRPFREHSWYNRCASHAHRIFHDARMIRGSLVRLPHGVTCLALCRSFEWSLTSIFQSCH